MKHLGALWFPVFTFFAFWAGPAWAEPTVWRVGLARARITPDQPMPMVGYGPRLSEGVLDDLHAKAMAVEWPGGDRAVLVTADLLFFRHDVAESLTKRITEKTGLTRRQILLNASHTHSGPIVGMNRDLDSFGVPADLRPRVAQYTAKLEQRLADLVAAALGDLQPATLRFAVGRADFVMNRRMATPTGIVMAPNPQGPVDRNVPVLRIDTPDGRLRALVFGCACHPVTLGGDNKNLSGDYASFAQSALENRFPNALAMFVIGCGGDANSHPRGTAEMARQQGASLADEVARVATGPMQPVRGPFHAALEWIDLPLAHDLTREQLQAMAAGPSVWHARNAKGMLETLAQGKPLPKSYRAPLAVWQFGGELTLVGLSGEAVAEYATRIAQLLGPNGLWVAAYCNESFGYLPTAQILKEGGHESMCLTLDIGLFAPQVEQVVLAEVGKLAERARKPSNPVSTPIAGKQAAHSTVVFPGEHWLEATPEQVGIDGKKLEEVIAKANIHGGGFGGVKVGDGQWGAVLTRNGYVVRRWGNPSYRYQQSASLGKCIVRALFGLSVEAGVIKPDEPIGKTWTGRGQLSHPHKDLDEGLHRQLTWRHLVEHQGGFVLESGFHWRNRTMFHGAIPPGVTWTGDPSFDNFAHTPPGSTTRYSSAGYWRLAQALTVAWKRDLKEVLDERLFRHLGIPADRWEWLPGKEVHDTRDFYPDFPGYGEYVDPPYEIEGRVVRGGPGWMRISAEDLARFGLLIATGGVWNGKRLIGSEWLRGHAGLDIHVVAGDPETMVAIAKINTKNFPFGTEVGTQGKFSFPKELLYAPVEKSRQP